MVGHIARTALDGAIDHAFETAASGHGQLVLLSGEAGAGKSTVVRSFADRVARRADVFVGHCDPLSAPRPGGPLIDMAPRLGGRLAEALAAGGREGLVDALLAAATIGDRPRVLVFEDVHWADELTLEMLGFLARRLGGLGVLVVATLRPDELRGEHPTRAWLDLVARLPGVVRVDVPALTLAEVTLLAAGSALDPPYLHGVTAGNAFFVCEVLADPTAGVPEGVANAVVARTIRLSVEERRALRAAAVLGPRVSPRLLLAIDGVRATAVDGCVAAGLLGFEPPNYVFRHELARQAVLAATPSTELRELNSVALRIVRPFAEPDLLAQLAEYAEQADDTAAVLELASAAAVRAAELGAHREAAAQLRRAVRHAVDEPLAHLAGLRERLAYELYLTAALDEAISEQRAALGLRRTLADPGAVGECLRWLSRLSWYAGRPREALEHAEQAVLALEPLGPTPALAMAVSTQSQVLMLRSRFRDAVEVGLRAVALAEESGDTESRAHALNNIGTSRFRLGEIDGLADLELSLEIALAHEMEDHASRAYVNLLSEAFLVRRSDLIDRHLGPALTFLAAHDVDLQWRYLTAGHALRLVDIGDWAAATETASTLIDLGSTTPVHRFVVLLPLLLIAVRQGEPHLDLLDEARAIAAVLDEPQRQDPIALIEIELAWLSGETAALTRGCGQLLASAQE
ncbi:MAG: AAA family ATPase, partial [Nocardioides sp.]